MTVEVRKTRTFTSNDGGRMVELKNAPACCPSKEQAEQIIIRQRCGNLKRITHLTDEERQSRPRALEACEVARRATQKERTFAALAAICHNAPSIDGIYDKKPLKEIVFDEEMPPQSLRAPMMPNSIS